MPRTKKSDNGRPIGSYAHVDKQGLNIPSIDIVTPDTEQDRVKRRYLDEWLQAVNQQGGFGRWRWDVAKQPGMYWISLRDMPAWRYPRRTQRAAHQVGTTQVPFNSERKSINEKTDVPVGDCSLGHTVTHPGGLCWYIECTDNRLGHEAEPFWPAAELGGHGGTCGSETEMGVQGAVLWKADDE